MTNFMERFRHYCQSSRASAVEFAFIMPFLFVILIGVVDGGSLYAQYTKAQQVAESLVRTARALDVQLVADPDRPLTNDTQALLRNIAARMTTHLPEDINFIWIGRFVRPPDGSAVRQTIPNGMTNFENNRGMILAGKADYATPAHASALEALDESLQPGDIVYVVRLRVTHGLMSPVPASMKRFPIEVRFAL